MIKHLLESSELTGEAASAPPKFMSQTNTHSALKVVNHQISLDNGFETNPRPVFTPLNAGKRRKSHNSGASVHFDNFMKRLSNRHGEVSKEE